MPTYCVDIIGTGTMEDARRPDLPAGTSFSATECESCGKMFVYTAEPVDGLDDADSCDCGTIISSGWVSPVE